MLPQWNAHNQKVVDGQDQLWLTLTLTNFHLFDGQEKRSDRSNATGNRTVVLLLLLLLLLLMHMGNIFK
jgi:hypothetical protein